MQDVRIWVDTKREGIDDLPYIEARILSNNTKTIECIDDDNKTYSLPIELWDQKGGFFLKNPENLEKVDNLVQLTYLHEPAVLNTLRTRYKDQTIYTYCGIVLVAVNPFCDVDIYNDFFIDLYHNQGDGSGALEPHIFAINEAAFSKLRQGHNQSIVISGESGAGKTKTATYSMRYFSAVGGTKDGNNDVEEQLEGSSVILEAFGNAKTTRNNNSSRFGKYMSLQFNKDLAVCGSVIQTFLLEKSRVVSQAENERGYHIFYHLLAYNFEMSPTDLKDLNLGDAMKYFYVNQGKTRGSDGIDDVALYEEVRHSMSVFGFTSEEQISIFRILAAILFMGNIDIVARRTSGEAEAVIKEGDTNLANACRVLDIKEKDFSTWLLQRKMPAIRGVSMIKKLSMETAVAYRDAFAKRLYADLFDWIVYRINVKLKNPTHNGNFVGILDIYGFEKFDTNSFEQFCINYANEKLQQQFNNHVFKLEQERYRREDIPWGDIAYHDNQFVIDLIEQKKNGILAVLDEEARLPKGSDDSFLSKLVTFHQKGDPKIKKKTAKPEGPFYLDMMHSQTIFCVTHYAEPVQYNIENFVEKNRDTVSVELMGLLQSSSEIVVKSLVERQAQQAEEHKTNEGAKNSFKTVAHTFRTSLDSLMTTIASTTPHYCRCLKSNQSKTAFLFQDGTMRNQLIACGVLETIEISSKGFPNQITYEECKKSYSMLIHSSRIRACKGMPLRNLAEEILTTVIKDEGMYALGKTLVFFKAGQLGFLDKIAKDRMKEMVTIYQRLARGFLARNRCQKLYQGVVCLEALFRGKLARQEHQTLREERAIQWVRVVLDRVRYIRSRQCIIAMQSVLRMRLAQAEYVKEKEYQLATLLQTPLRGYLARTWVNHYLKSVIRVQCLWRCRVAKRELKELKMQAKDVSNLKQKTGLLENKIMSLQRRLDEQLAVNKRMKAEVSVISAGAMQEIKAQLETVEEEKRELVIKVNDLEYLVTVTMTTVATTKEELEKLSQEYKAEKERVLLLEEELEKERSLVQTKSRMITDTEPRIEKEKLEMTKTTKVIGRHVRRATSQPSSSPNGFVPIKLANQPPLGPLASYSQEMASSPLSLPPQNNRNLTDQLDELKRKSEVLANQLDSTTAQRDQLQMRLDTLTDPSTVEENVRVQLDKSIQTVQVLEAQHQQLRDENTCLHNQIKMLAGDTSPTPAIIPVSVGAPEYNNNNDATITSLMAEDAQIAVEHAVPSPQRLVTDEASTLLIANLRREVSELRKELEHVDRKELVGELEAVQTENTMLHEQCISLTERLREQQIQLAMAPSHPQKAAGRRASLAGMRPQEAHRHPIGGNKLSRRTSTGVIPIKSEPDSIIFMNENIEEQAEEKTPLQGMLKFMEADTSNLLHGLIVDLDLEQIEKETPGLVAYLLFMSMRWIDQEGEGEKLMSFATDIISCFKHVLTKNHTNIKLLCFWLHNITVLIDCMLCAEDVGDDVNPEFQLQFFDLFQVRQVLEGIRDETFKIIIRAGQQMLSKMVVPAMLEFNLLEDKHKNNPRAGETGPQTVHDVIRVLVTFLNALHNAQAEQDVVDYLIMSLVRFIAGTCLNNLPLRRDLCNFNRSLVIAYNITTLDNWLRDHDLMMAKGALDAITQ
eukprot:Ihof_evm10s34 gene=Ihof_evmTU10s34